MIIVLGPGRSGTSTVARILHNHLGISMGVRFREPNEANPSGYFEDLDFRDLNEAILTNKLDPMVQNYEIGQLFRKRQEPWGIKDPRISQLYFDYGKYVCNAQFIVAMRKPQLIVRSMMQCYGWSEKESKQLLIIRLDGISKLLEGHEALYIDFSIKREDKELINLIQRWI